MRNRCGLRIDAMRLDAFVLSIVCGLALLCGPSLIAGAAVYTEVSQRDMQRTRLL